MRQTEILNNLESELEQTKALMRRAAREFQLRVPPVGTSGWIVILVKCSKHCARCPHSITWQRYVRVKLKKPGPTGNTTRLIYKEKSQMIPRARFLPTHGRAHSGFQKILVTLNAHSKDITRSIKRIRQCECEADKRRKRGELGVGGEKSLRIISSILDMVRDIGPSLMEIRQALDEFCRNYPVSPQKRHT